jgi:hypothetical protein
MIGIESEPVSTGAAYAGLVDHPEQRAEEVVSEILERYNEAPKAGNPDQRPLAFLQWEVSDYYSLFPRLRNEMLKDVETKYDLYESYEDPAVQELVHIASKPGQDGFLDGQSWSEAGTLWFMEETGLIQEIQK